MKRLLACLLVCLFLFPITIRVRADDGERAADVLPGIEGYEFDGSTQDWLDGKLSDEAGIGAEWYVLSLIKTRPDLDFTKYEAALRAYLTTHTVTSPVTKMKLALVLACLCSSPDDVSEILSESIGRLGIMSWIWGLHLINAGYETTEYTSEEVLREILDRQNDDGGWAISGSISDVDVTAMTLQALAGQKERTEVAQAIERALALLVSRQLPSGGFSSYGTENAESGAQVILTLSTLGVSAEETGFEGGTERMFEGVLQFASENGGFTHEEGGTVNEVATSQVYLAFSAYLAYRYGRTPLFYPDAAPGSFQPSDSVDKPFPYLAILIPVLAVGGALFGTLFVLHRKRAK